jgi:hypothetical protein
MCKTPLIKVCPKYLCDLDIVLVCESQQYVYIPVNLRINLMLAQFQKKKKLGACYRIEDPVNHKMCSCIELDHLGLNLVKLGGCMITIFDSCMCF